MRAFTCLTGACCFSGETEALRPRVLMCVFGLRMCVCMCVRESYLNMTSGALPRPAQSEMGPRTCLLIKGSLRE